MFAALVDGRGDWDCVQMVVTTFSTSLPAAERYANGGSCTAVDLDSICRRYGLLASNSFLRGEIFFERLLKQISLYSLRENTCLIVNFDQ